MKAFVRLVLFGVLVFSSRTAWAGVLQPMDTHDVGGAGASHTCVLTVDGHVRCWGAGSKGQIGNGSSPAYSTTPAQVTAIDDAIAVSAGADHTCALRNDGTVWCWGDNSKGQLGDTTTRNRNFPVPVHGLDRVVAVAAGAHHTCALNDEGSVYCWGANDKHQIDAGVSTLASIVSAPVLREAMAFVGIGAGAGADQTCGIRGNGSVTCWGDVGPTQNLITNNYQNGVIQVVAGAEFSCVLLASGWVKCVGSNDESQLRGAPSSTWTNNPTFVWQQPADLTPTSVTRITAGIKHVCARTATGAVWCWGRNSSDQAGQSGSGPIGTPLSVPGISNVSGVYAGASHTCATTADGRLVCWGANDSGQLGSSSCTAPPCIGTSTPTVVTPDPDVDRIGGAVLSAAYLHTCIRKPDSTVWCWGYDAFGQQGVGTTATARSTPTQAVTLPSDQVVSMSAGAFHGCALFKNGTVQCWGRNNYGQLGNGSTVTPNPPMPVTVVGVSNAIAVESGENTSCALMANGQLKCWGLNSSQQAGGPAGTTAVSTPVAITYKDAPSSVFSAAAIGRYHACAVLMGASPTDGGHTVCWGGNTHDECGASSGTVIATPNLAGMGNVASLSSNGTHTCEINGFRSASCWGDNSNGQLGNGSTSTAVYTPQQGWANTWHGAAGLLFTCSQTVGNDRAFCVGANSSGQLGDGTFAQQLTPVPTAASVFSRALASGGFHACALGSRGQVTCWGADSYGQLGDSRSTSTGTPVSTVGFACNAGDSFWNDGNPCTHDRCTVTTGGPVTQYDPIPGETCSDGLVCDGPDDKCDSSGMCKGDPAFTIDDGNACTADACDETQGITHTPISTDDGNQCTADSCNSATGPTHTVTAGASCVNQCVFTPTCSSQGVCTGSAKPLADNNPCTDDKCDPVTGPYYPPTAAGTACDTGKVCDGAGRCDAPIGPLPPDPTVTAPVISADLRVPFANQVAFLYAPPAPVQAIQTPSGTTPISLDPALVGVIRGTVKGADGLPLPGVGVTVKDHPEYGQTLTRADGMFDLAANGGGALVVALTRTGYLSAQRHVYVPWNDYAFINDVVLVKPDPVATSVAICATCGGPMRIAQSSITSGDGPQRQAVMLFPPDVTMQFSSGTQSLTVPSTVTVRATEYTNSAHGGPNAMPGELPATSAYTYAAEFTIDEAVSAGATRVDFYEGATQDAQHVAHIPVYVDDILNLTAGTVVPVGFYDRTLARWVPNDNGNVVKILSITSGLADVDTDGDGVADNAGISAAERQALGTQYVAPKTLWRVPLSHFSPYDFNWPYGMPACNASTPATGGPCPNDPGPKIRTSSDIENPTCRAGSIIECENQALREKVQLAGTPLTLNYTSTRAPGAYGSRALQIVLPPTYHATRLGTDVRVTVAGHQHVVSFANSPTTCNPSLVSDPLPANLNCMPAVYEWSWTDTTDAYGRPLSGEYVAEVEVIEVYPALYKAGSVFGSTSSGGVINTARDRGTFEVRYSFTTKLRAYNAKSAPVGGWWLSAQHRYNPVANVLENGDGTEHAFQGRSLVPFAGNGTYAGCYPLTNGACPGDGGPATQASIPYPGGLAVAPNGDVFISTAYANYDATVAPSYGHIVLRVAKKDGTIQRFAGLPTQQGTGGGQQCGTGDVHSALIHCFANPRGLAVEANGAVYVVDATINTTIDGSLWRIDPDGMIHRVAGNGTTFADGVSALDAKFDGTTDVALAPDGTIYMPDFSTNRIRRIGTDGIITTLAGSGSATFSGDNGPAIAAGVPQPASVAVGPEGSVYFTSGISADRIRRVTPDGTITTVAGGGQLTPGFNARLGTDASLSGLSAIRVAPSNMLYFATSYGVFSVEPNGAIDMLAGVHQNGATEAASLYSNVNVTGFDTAVPAARTSVLPSEQALAVVPDGSILVGETSQRVRRILDAVPKGAFRCAQQCAYYVPATAGDEAYCFDPNGRHLCTVNATTGATLYTFAYDATSGRLTDITDGDGNLTHIGYDAAGNPTQIVAPFGQTTKLDLTTDGYLWHVSDPLNQPTTLEYYPGGLLKALTNARDLRYSFEYDSLGRLKVDHDPQGGSQTLSRDYFDGPVNPSDTTDLTRQGRTVTVTTALNRSTEHTLSVLSDGAVSQKVTGPDGLTATTETDPSGIVTTTSPDGTINQQVLGLDQQWSATRMTPTSDRLRLPSLSSGWSLTTDHAIPAFTFNSDGTVASRTDTWTTSGTSGTPSVTTVAYDGSAQKYTVTTAAQRQVATTVDAQGRPVHLAIGGILPLDIQYDHGRLATVTQGGRVRTLGYSSAADLTKGYRISETVTATSDTRTYSTVFLPDGWGRVLRSTTNGIVTQTSWDANGNLSTVTPPSKPVHSLAYDGLDRLSEYSAPFVPSVYVQQTTYGYDLDRAFTSETLPDGRQTSFVYDPTTGRLQSIVLPSGTFSLEYDNGASCPVSNPGPSCKGQLTAMRGPATGANLGYTYDGPLTKSEKWTNPTDGSLIAEVDWGFDGLLRPNSEQLIVTAATLPSSFDYDADNLVTCASSAAPPCTVSGVTGEQISYDPMNGLLKGTTLASASDTRSYNAYGELATYTATVASSPVLSETYDSTEFPRDGLGRVTRLSRTQSGVHHDYDYTYDLLGRLTDVARDGQPLSHYAYDDNGNRLSFTPNGGSAINGTYDGQDRLVNYGATTYTYSSEGALATKTNGSQTTTYTYDLRGSLQNVSLPDGRQITYVNDALGRRVVKYIGTTLKSVYVYSGSRIIAELTPTYVSRFVYGSRSNVPDFVVQGGITYKIFADRLGSPRLVVRADAPNTTLVNIDYDEFGNIIGSPVGFGALPFGFAGGLYDVDTGLVRFGARDYDPATGRWTAPDPIGYDGLQANLYEYAGNDPVNFSDMTGLLAGVPDWLLWLDDNGWLQAAGDFSAGASSALTFGLSDRLIDATGLGQYGSVCSTAYHVGEYATYALAAARLGYAGLAKAGSLAFRAPTMANLGASVGWRNGLKVAFRLGLSRARVYTTSEVLAKYGGDVAKAIAASGRTDSFLNAYAAAILGYGAQKANTE